MIDEAHKITGMFARQSTFALLYGSKEGAKIPIRAILDFPGVHGLALYDSSGRLLYSEGVDEIPLPAGEEHWPHQIELERESPDAWFFVAPVYLPERIRTRSSIAADAREGGKLIGFVRLVMGKETLHAMERDILVGNLLVSFLLAGLLLIVLLVVVRQVTRPLGELATVMQRAQAGESGVRATIHGASDIVAMGETFNGMMAALEKHETELKVARDAALQLASVKSEFAANVSHELRTPLNGVLGMLELLRDMGLTARQREYVEVAHNSGESLLALIDGILDFSRIDAGKLQLEPEDFVLRDVLEEVIQLLATQAQSRDLDLGFITAPELPSSLRGDPRRIRQVLLNLVGNAVKFTTRGEVAIEVHIDDTTPDRPLLRFDVIDTGCGIPTEAQRTIFEPFTQADGSTSRVAGGAGLGLTISRQLVDFMGGDIGVVSKPGKGSRFWFTIPLERAAGREKLPNHHDSMPGVTVLVVDDSRIARGYLKQLLESWGASPAVASNDEEALQMLRHATAAQRPFEVALIDNHMPQMDGLPLVEKIAGDDRITPLGLIMMSSRRCSCKRGTRAGIVGCITKPVRETVLYDVLSSALKEAQLETFFHCGVEPGEPPSPARHTVLVAEDNRANQLVIKGMLERLGCQVEIAVNGDEAVQKARSGQYGLILMDCQMPQVDGYTATVEIRAGESGGTRVPIIAMTANVQKQDSERCMSSGMDDFLPKPIKLDMLESILERWLPPVETTPQAGRENSPAATLDERVMSELRDTIGGNLGGLFQVFLEDIPGYIHTLEESIAADDAEALVQAAHAIKGSSGNVGATRLAKIARELEQLGRSSTVTEADRWLLPLREELSRVEASMRREMEKENDGSHSEMVEQQHSCVLIVDDDRGMRYALRSVVESSGYLVQEVANGSQAITFCERQIPDLILIDALMPRMDGFAACRKIRTLPGCAGIPVLMVTALDDEHSIEKAFKAGATDYIPKPVHFGLLRLRINRLLRAGYAEKRMHQLAYHDALTGLPNREYFMEHLASLLRKTRPDDEKLALLFLDLDRFKLINDTLGHDTGDQLLKAASGRIAGCVRNRDLVARLGGDEFTVLLDRIHSTDEVARIADKICKVLSEPFSFSGREMYISVSIGIVLSPDNGTDLHTLLKKADMAMFRAKEEGSDYRFYVTGMGSKISKRLKLENELRLALERRELQVHYQPQLDLRSGEVVAMEALVRWPHLQDGMISPTEFIPLAEEIGLIVPLGEYVLRTACSQAQRWRRQGYPELRVAVNLSSLELDSAGLPEHVGKLLEETGLPSRLLELEITESIIMKHADAVISVLKELRALGINLAIDDFGTGYSSLSYLRHFPINTLKIDRSFIPDITTHPGDAAVITSIISLAQKLRLIVVAEGVETAEQQAFLLSQGCDLVQGNHISKPLSATEFEQRILRKTGGGSIPVRAIS